MNKVTLIGNLGADPVGKVLPSGDMVVNVSLASNESWKDKDGTKQERTTWFALAFWGRLGEIAEQYLRKGSQIYVEGTVSARAYLDKQSEAKASLEVRVRELKMLGSRTDGDDSAAPAERAARPARTAAAPPPSSAQVQEEFDDEIPF